MRQAMKHSIRCIISRLAGLVLFSDWEPWNASDRYMEIPVLRYSKGHHDGERRGDPIRMRKVAYHPPYGSSMASCHICSDNASQDVGEEMWGVARLTTGYVRLNPNQYFRGACFFLTKSCVHELHDLDRGTRDAHLAEMAEVAAALWSVFSPKKLNYEALGNGAPHLHWWLTPRYESDPRGFAPIWEDLEILASAMDERMPSG